MCLAQEFITISVYLTGDNVWLKFDVFVSVSRAKQIRLCCRWLLRFIFTRFDIFRTRFFRSLRQESSMLSLLFVSYQSSKISEERKISKIIFYCRYWTVLECFCSGWSKLKNFREVVVVLIYENSTLQQRLPSRTSKFQAV